MSEVKKYPKCGGDMKKEHVSARSPVYFTDRLARLRIGGHENTCASLTKTVVTSNYTLKGRNRP
jgi:hypothetical protein